MREGELAGRIEDAVHRLAVRIYYEDTDFSGAVYHANYLKFCERGRSDFLRLAGVHHHELAREETSFVVRRMICDFLKPARIDDILCVETRLLELAGARLELRQDILREKERLFAAEVTAALVDRRSRPVRLPRGMAATLSRLARPKPTA